MNTEHLNPEQAKAVNTINGPVLIIAGAGSGKTRVITFRIAHMLESGIPQSQILALTFTNKAAREMEQRIKELTGRKLQNLTISTFHALGVKILREYIDRLGWRQNFCIYDEVDRNQHPDAEHRGVVLIRWLQSVSLPFITAQGAGV